MGISALLIAFTMFVSLHQTTPGQVCPQPYSRWYYNTPHPDDCSRYCVECSIGYKSTTLIKKCKPHEWFNPVNRLCTYDKNKLCVNGSLRMPCSRIVCHYSTLHAIQRERRKMFPQELRETTRLCTHIIFSSPFVRGKGVFDFGVDSAAVHQLLEWTVSLKKKFPNVKVLFKVDMRAYNYRQQLWKLNTYQQKKSTLIRNTVQFVEKYDLDGITLHWDVNSDDIKLLRHWMLIGFIADLRKAFKKRKKKHILVLSLNHKKIIDKYLFKSIVYGLATKLDFMIVDTFDDVVYRDLLRRVGIVYGKKHSSSLFRTFLKDLVITVPLLAKTYTVGYRGQAISKGKNMDDEYTWEKAYYEVCYDKKNRQREHIRYLGKKGAYGQSYRQGYQLVLYNGEKSVRAKARMVVEFGLGGLMIKSIGHDDFRGFYCDKGQFPLIHAICDECYNYKRSNT